MDRLNRLFQQTEENLEGVIKGVIGLIKRDVDSALGPDTLPPQADQAADARRQGQVLGALAKIKDLRAEAEQLAQSCAAERMLQWTFGGITLPLPVLSSGRHDNLHANWQG